MATTRYTALLVERDRLTAESKAVIDRADAEGRSLTAEEKAADDERYAEIEKISAEMADIEARRARSGAAEAAKPTAARITGLHDRAGDAPWGYELGVRMIDRPDGTRAFGGIRNATDVALGHCMQAIFRAGMGGNIDPRLMAASGGNTSDPAAGGFSVGTDLSMALMQMGMESSMLLPYCNVIEISANSDSLEAPYFEQTSRATGSRFGGIQIYRRKEAATVTAQYPEEEKFSLSLLDLMGLAYTTDRLMADAAAMGRWYGNAFRSEFAFVIDNELVRGTGVGECEGFLNSAALVTVAAEAGQDVDTIVNENISKMWIRMPSRLKGGAIWLYNSECGPQLDDLSIPVGVGGLEPRFVNYGPDGVLRLKGRPAIEIEQASALGDVGDIALVNLGEYIVIRKGGIEEATSDHVRFIYGERTFRWTQRINGRSPWRSAVTPFKGSATVSPFVALAAR